MITNVQPRFYETQCTCQPEFVNHLIVSVSL